MQMLGESRVKIGGNLGKKLRSSWVRMHGKIRIKVGKNL